MRIWLSSRSYCKQPRLEQKLFRHVSNCILATVYHTSKTNRLRILLCTFHVSSFFKKATREMMHYLRWVQSSIDSLHMFSSINHAVASAMISTPLFWFSVLFPDDNCIILIALTLIPRLLTRHHQRFDPMNNSKFCPWKAITDQLHIDFITQPSNNSLASTTPHRFLYVAVDLTDLPGAIRYTSPAQRNKQTDP